MVRAWLMRTLALFACLYNSGGQCPYELASARCGGHRRPPSPTAVRHDQRYLGEQDSGGARPENPVTAFRAALQEFEAAGAHSYVALDQAKSAQCRAFAFSTF